VQNDAHILKVVEADVYDENESWIMNSYTIGRVQGKCGMRYTKLTRVRPMGADHNYMYN
jgi:hypothetical protein